MLAYCGAVTVVLCTAHGTVMVYKSVVICGVVV